MHKTDKKRLGLLSVIYPCSRCGWNVQPTTSCPLWGAPAVLKGQLEGCGAAPSLGTQGPLCRSVSKGWGRSRADATSVGHSGICKGELRMGAELLLLALWENHIQGWEGLQQPDHPSCPHLADSLGKIVPASADEPCTAPVSPGTQGTAGAAASVQRPGLRRSKGPGCRFVSPFQEALGMLKGCSHNCFIAPDKTKPTSTPVNNSF